MKKLVVLMALLVVAGMLWAQAPAAPAAPTFTMGLTLDYMWAQDFVGPEYSDRPILELKFNWKADDFTTAYVELEEGPMSSQGDTGGGTAGLQGGYRNIYSTVADRGYDVKIAGLDKAWFMTDLGKALKLPVPVTVKYGYEEWNNADSIKVTKSEYEDFLGEADIRNWGAQIEVKPSPMVTLRSNWAWNPGAAQLAEGQFLIGAYGTVAPVSYEFTYDTHGFEASKGWIEGGLKFVQDVSADLNVAAMVAFQYDMADEQDYVDMGMTAGQYWAYGWNAFELADAPTWYEWSAYQVQAGLQVMYQKMAAFGVSYRGAEEVLDGAVQLQGYFTPKAGDPLEFFAQIGLGINSDVFAETLDSAEVALRYTIGKTMWYLGFEYVPEFGRGIAKEWADFDLRGLNQDVSGNGLFDLNAETTAIFVRGRVAL
jgi:hypothetical protein